MNRITTFFHARKLRRQRARLVIKLNEQFALRRALALAWAKAAEDGDKIERDIAAIDAQSRDGVLAELEAQVVK